MKQMLLVLLLGITLQTSAQTDTLQTQYSPACSMLRGVAVGAPVVVGGLIAQHQDKDYRDLPESPLKEYNGHIDDYLRFSPLAVMVGMKALGVPSRSSWTRMIASGASSFVIMTGAVEALKHTTDVRRPDGSDKHSFPSGHTATAFMAATMLSKEYGHLSPWVTVGAYSMAAATGFMRVDHNKHWVSDVLVGAGIGIISTELGYYIVDALMKDKGLNKHTLVSDALLADRNPSFVGLYSGFNQPVGAYTLSKDKEYKTSGGSVIGAEGAWFMNRHLGIGGRASLSNLRVIVNGKEAAESTLDFYSVYAGPYLNIPLSSQFSVGTKALAGYIHFMRSNIAGEVIPAHAGWGFGTGVNIDYVSPRRVAYGIFADYNILPPHSNHSGEFLHTLTLGARASIRF